MKQRGKSTRHNLMLMMVAMLLVVSLIGGAMAWLTSNQTLANKFQITVGEVKQPETPNGDEEDEPKAPEDGAVGLVGNIYEPSFKQNTEIELGSVVTKDPYIGVGAKSEESYVFAWWVDNTQYIAEENGETLTGAFEINVDEKGNSKGQWELVNADKNLYVWADKDGNPLAIGGAEVEKSTWTSVLFKDGKITVKDDIYKLVAANEEGTNISVDVHCLIHQAEDADGNSLYETAKNEALTACGANE